MGIESLCHFLNLSIRPTTFKANKIDFLTFKSFISNEVLIAFYYIGAVLIPLAAWYLVTRLVNKYQFINTSYEKGKDVLWRHLNKRQKTRLIILSVSFFLFMELFWRMLFEFLIAYIQIRDALVQHLI